VDRLTNPVWYSLNLLQKNIMPSKKISEENNTAPHFLTLTVKNWYYLFDRHNRWDILLDSLCYCQKQKELKIFHWVFMLNHVHLIVQSDNLSGFLCDFKKFTSKRLKENIIATEPNVLELFLDEEGNYSFWQKTNMPIALETEKVFHQKANYIEHNPVRKGYVDEPEHWKYSSAHKMKLLHLDCFH
jgi:putative transposase